MFLKCYWVTHFVLYRLMYSQNLTFNWPVECLLCFPSHLVCIFFRVKLLVSMLIFCEGTKKGKETKDLGLPETLLSGASPFTQLQSFFLPSLSTLQSVSCPKSTQQFFPCLIFLLISCLLASWYFCQWCVHNENIKSPAKLCAC